MGPQENGSNSCSIVTTLIMTPRGGILIREVLVHWGMMCRNGENGKLNSGWCMYISYRTKLEFTSLSG